MTAKKIRLLRFDLTAEFGFQDVLRQTADAGINLLCVMAVPGGEHGQVYGVPCEESDVIGFHTVDGIHLVSPDYCGAGADSLAPLQEAGVTVNACFAVAEWHTAHVVLLVDDVDRALAILRAAREPLAA